MTRWGGIVVAWSKADIPLTSADLTSYFHEIKKYFRSCTGNWETMSLNVGDGIASGTMGNMSNTLSRTACTIYLQMIDSSASITICTMTIQFRQTSRSGFS